MSDFKKCKRVVDKSLLEYIKTLPCEICGKGNCDPSHITSVGAGGGDTVDNVIAHCRAHHREWHDTGRFTFIKKYPKMKLWLYHHNRHDLLDRMEG